MKILIYISGHGFGHATRIVAIMKALILKEPSLRFFIKTRVSKDLFEEFPPPVINYYEKALDVGVIEKNIFSQDVYSTLIRYSELNSKKKEIVNSEVEFVKREEINLILSDIPPLASDIGYSAKIPVIAIGNFCWDFIYEPYVQLYPKFSHLIKQIKASYNKTDMLLRLPFHHSMESFPKKQDVPLVVRKCSRCPEETKLNLGISPNDTRPIIFLALRLGDTCVKNGINDILNSNDFLVLSTESFSKVDNNKLFIIPSSMRIAEFPNILAASDLIIAKLGYGIATECISVRTPLIYTHREDFSEFRILQENTRNFLPSYCIPKSDFLEGNWYTHVREFLGKTSNWIDIRTDGAEIAADKILSYKK